MQKLEKWLEVILSVVFAVAILISFVQIIFRYVLNNSLVWSDELTRYLFIALVFIGAAMASLRDEHIKLEVIPERFKRLKNGLGMFSDAAILIFLVFLLVLGLLAVRKNMAEVTPAMQIPFGYVYLSIPLGCIFSIAFIFWRILKHKDRQAEEEKP